MKLRHIYITKEGEPMGIDPNCTSSKFNDSLLPFEDAMKIFPLHVRLTDIKPDTLIPVDLEVEVVDVFTKEEMLKIAQGDGFGVSSAYVPSKNKVLRIKN